MSFQTFLIIPRFICLKLLYKNYKETGTELCSLFGRRGCCPAYVAGAMGIKTMISLVKLTSLAGLGKIEHGILK